MISAAEISPFVRGSWKEIVETHAGAPFIVHFWGLTCAPCRKEMAGWGQLLNESPSLRLVTINADIVPNDPDEALEFLEQSGLGEAQNFIFAEDFVDPLRFEIDPSWQGEIPLSLLIDADGTRTKIEGAAEPDAVRAWLTAKAK
jgi:thiol-disulfide isomerase/thioredoxin